MTDAHCSVTHSVTHHKKVIKLLFPAIWCFVNVFIMLICVIVPWNIRRKFLTGFLTGFYGQSHRCDRVRVGRSALQECTNNSIAGIKQWYDMNKLVINTAKSNVMVVSSKQRHALSGASNIDVHLGNENIKQIDCIDYLGVKLDAHLTCNDQIDAVCKKLVFIISRLSRLRHVLAPRILMYSIFIKA